MKALILAALLALPAAAETVPGLLALIQSLPKLPLIRNDLRVQAPAPGWELGMISTLAVRPDGSVYLLQRGHQADPIVLVDRHGKVVHSWGANLFAIPHGIRISPAGDVWTVDSASSMVRKFAQDGTQKLEIAAGGQPSAPAGRAVGTTDITFSAGRVFVSDGYRNARIIEYAPDGKKITEWGAPGDGPGQFHIPHAIAAAGNLVYVADRENGRIQVFDLDGRFRAAWDHLGKPMSLHLGPQQTIWVGTNLTSGALTGGYVLKLDRQTGKPLGYLEAGEGDVHAMAVTETGDVLVAGKGMIEWFRAAN